MALNNDEKYIKMCFSLAKKGKNNVLPNPMVGSLIVKEGRIISKGYHKKYGEFHAERNAILNAKEDLEGATIYVNLEPCSHFGKTPPCADLIIEKKIKRVVFSSFDKNPKVDGVKKLKEKGIEVLGGVLEKEGDELNKVFFKNITKKIPYIALKTATTLDSKIATENYNSKWITGDSSRLEVMKLRSLYQAIITGSNTVLYDNPKLTSRIKGGINPIRIIMDKKGQIPFNYNVFENDGTRIILIDNTKRKCPSHVEKIGFSNINELLKTLFNMGIYSILIESGRGLNSAFLKEKCVDEIYHFIAPKILGGGINFIDGFNPKKIDDGLIAYNLKIKKFEPDIMLNYKLKF